MREPFQRSILYLSFIGLLHCMAGVDPKCSHLDGRLGINNDRNRWKRPKDNNKDPRNFLKSLKNLGKLKVEK